MQRTQGQCSTGRGCPCLPHPRRLRRSGSLSICLRTDSRCPARCRSAPSLSCVAADAHAATCRGCWPAKAADCQDSTPRTVSSRTPLRHLRKAPKGCSTHRSGSCAANRWGCSAARSSWASPATFCGARQATTTFSHCRRKISGGCSTET